MLNLEKTFTEFKKSVCRIFTLRRILEDKCINNETRWINKLSDKHIYYLNFHLKFSVYNVQIWGLISTNELIAQKGTLRRKSNICCAKIILVSPLDCKIMDVCTNVYKRICITSKLFVLKKLYTSIQCTLCNSINTFRCTGTPSHWCSITDFIEGFGSKTPM